MRAGDRGLCCLVTLLAVVGALASEEAYVTLLYGDEFLLGVRVLGKSIRDTGTKKDTVVLVSDGVSDYATRLLQVFLIVLSPSFGLLCPSIFFCYGHLLHFIFIHLSPLICSFWITCY